MLTYETAPFLFVPYMDFINRSQVLVTPQGNSMSSIPFRLLPDYTLDVLRGIFQDHKILCIRVKHATRISCQIN